MAAACKDTRAKGPFGLWLFTKHPVSAVDDSLQESPSDFTVSGSSASDPAAAREAEREGLRSRFRRSGSKFLSFLGLRDSAPREEVVQAARPPTKVTQKTVANVAAAKFTDDHAQGETASLDGHGPTSGPRLVHRLSTKLSRTFGKSTVHHGGRFRSRRDGQFSDCYTTLTKQGDGANDSSNPSTPLSGSGYPGSHTNSTPPTSGKPSPYQSKFVFGSEYLKQQYGFDPQQLAAMREEPQVPLSIKTVEKTTNAKVFLETHYDSLEMDMNARKARAREFSSYLRAVPLSDEQRAKARKDFYKQESRYLRKCRVLWSPIIGHREPDAVARYGYEPSKLLGCGSFGFVRLVRQREIDGSVPFDRSFDLEPYDPEYYDVARHCMAGRKKEVFAMKVIRKSEMIRNTQEGHVRAERDMLVRSEKSRWFVPLVASFQDTDNLYLVMDYMVGGDFLGLLIRKNTLPEQWAKFYLAEMVLCVEEAHRLGWIHRDLKPDNFLISASGHLRLSDFGLSFNGHWAHDKEYYTSHRQSLLEKLGIEVDGDIVDKKLAEKRAKSAPGLAKLESYVPHRRRFANSYVGTAQYMAPEVIKGEQYDGRCDWWSLGIILHECLIGTTPFACDDREEMRARIINHNKTINFPWEEYGRGEVSLEAMDMISVLVADKERRLGSERYKHVDTWMASGLEQDAASNAKKVIRAPPPFVYSDDSKRIKEHIFFQGVDWNQVHRIRPPFVPMVRGWGDTRYFEQSFSSCCVPDGYDDNDSYRMPSLDDSDSGPDELPKIVLPKRDPKQILKRRPRDKILRDKYCGRTAMKVRKDGAFTGYSYLRPEPVAKALESAVAVPKEDLSDLYAC